MIFKKTNITFILLIPFFITSCANNEPRKYELDKKEILVNQEFKPFKELTFNEEKFDNTLLFVKALNAATIRGSGVETVVICDTTCDFFLNIYFVDDTYLEVKSIYSIEIVVMEL
ncbi:MAG TPA: hypothetical protein DDW20_04350 [Firmicutes bacterium]|nr:hypothetical protein [Bacillota bacterium]